MVRAAGGHRRLLRPGAVDGRGAAPSAQRARAGYVEIDGVAQPAPAPRFSRSPLAAPTPPEPPGVGGPA